MGEHTVPNGAFTEQDREILNRIQKDMYYGNGLPGLTTRMADGEKRMDRIEKAQGSIGTRLNWLMTLLVMTLISVIVGLVTHR